MLIQTYGEILALRQQASQLAPYLIVPPSCLANYLKWTVGKTAIIRIAASAIPYMYIDTKVKCIRKVEGESFKRRNTNAVRNPIAPMTPENKVSFPFKVKLPDNPYKNT